MPFKVGAEDDPFSVGREMNVRLERIVMVLHVDQLCGLHAVTIIVEAEDPLVLVGVGYRGGTAAVADDETLVPGCREVYGPLVTGDPEVLFRTCPEVHATDEEVLRPGLL